MRPSQKQCQVVIIRGSAWVGPYMHAYARANHYRGVHYTPCVEFANYLPKSAFLTRCVCMRSARKVKGEPGKDQLSTGIDFAFKSV